VSSVEMTDIVQQSECMCMCVCVCVREASLGITSSRHVHSAARYTVCGFDKKHVLCFAKYRLGRLPSAIFYQYLGISQKWCKIGT